MSQLPTENPKQKHSHYFKNVEVLAHIDVYRVLKPMRAEDMPMPTSCNGITDPRAR